MPDRVVAASVLRAVDSCLEAVLEPSRWPSVLDAIGEAAASTGAVMFLYGGCDRASFLCSERCSDSMDEYLRSDWCKKNPRLEVPPDDTIRSDADFEPDERQARNNLAFRDGFLRRHDMGWFAGTSLLRTADRHILVSVERPFRRGAFEASELRSLDRAFGHMRRAVSLIPSMNGRLRTALLDGFQGSGSAAAIIDLNATLLQLNSSAEYLLPKVFRVRHGRLRTVEARHTSAWEAFLHRLTNVEAGVERIPSPLLLPSLQATQIVVRGIPLPVNANDFFRRAAAVIVFDAFVRPPPALEVLRSVFGLTQAEARLAFELAIHCNLATAGKALGISHETARSHLKAVFAKTQSASQAECLVKLTGLR